MGSSQFSPWFPDICFCLWNSFFVKLWGQKLEKKCRKIAHAQNTGQVNKSVWEDSKQQTFYKHHLKQVSVQSFFLKSLANKHFRYARRMKNRKNISIPYLNCHGGISLDNSRNRDLTPNKFSRPKGGQKSQLWKWCCMENTSGKKK